jgi:hypothetical protein
VKFFVKAHPKSKREKVVRVDENHFEVWVKEPPDKGKANEAVREKLAEHLGVARSKISVVSGHASRSKVIELLEA